MNVQKEIDALRRELERHNKLYYVLDAPEISDYEYDMLMNRLKELEAAHPELITKDSPTQRVGGVALSQFEQVRHQVPLESLTDVFSYEELFAFGERMDSLVREPHDYTVEPKIDGLSMSLEYENGVLRQYIENGQIEYKFVAFGKTMAAANVSDDRSDQRNSVYNPAAARERRIEIIAVEIERK